jgi:predicted TIM-barrel fold metal-dependent hydrolase
MLIDHHAHWLPEALLQALARRREPPMAWREDGRWVFLAAVKPRLLNPETSDLQLRATDLRSLGIGGQVLSLSTLWRMADLTPDEAMPLLRCFNDETAAARCQHPLFQGLATVPIADVGLACDELERSLELGLSGVILPAHAFADLRSADRWAPLFEVLQKFAARAFIHPGTTPLASPGAAGCDTDWHRRLGLEPQHEIGLAMFTLCHDAWLADYPGVPVQFANLGGSFTPAIERMQRMAEAGDVNGARRRQALFRVTVDSASLGPSAIAAAQCILGRDAVVFGTDMPLFDAGKAVADWRFNGTGCSATDQAREQEGAL